MPKVTAAAAALIAVLALAGCASGGASDDASTERAAATSESIAPQPSTSPSDEAPEPLAAETAAPETPEALFVQEARDRLDGLGAASTIPSATDDQLVTGGREACEALTAGTPFADVTVVEGEERVQGSYLDSAAITTAAVLFFCPELNGSFS